MNINNNEVYTYTHTRAHAHAHAHGPQGRKKKIECNIFVWICKSVKKSLTSVYNINIWIMFGINDDCITFRILHLCLEYEYEM